MVKRTVKLTLAATSALIVLLLAGAAAAAEGGEVSAEAAKFGAFGWMGLAAGIGIGIAAFGGALGQARAAAAALDGIARNPGASGKIFTPMILGLALIESLVIYALIIAILLLGKITL